MSIDKHVVSPVIVYLFALRCVIRLINDLFILPSNISVKFNVFVSLYIIIYILNRSSLREATPRSYLSDISHYC